MSHNLKQTTMKKVFILIEKKEVNNINGFYDRKEMMQHEADNLNSELKNLLQIKSPISIGIIFYFKIFLSNWCFCPEDSVLNRIP